MKCIVVNGTGENMDMFYIPLNSVVDLISYEEKGNCDCNMNCQVSLEENGKKYPYWYPEESLLFLNDNVLVNERKEE